MTRHNLPVRNMAAAALLLMAAMIALALSQPSAAIAAGGADLRVQVVDARGLPVRDAVVEVRPASGSSGPITFPWRMGMVQRDQEFVPGTLVVARGSTVAFPNLDRVRHSIYSFSRPARFEIELYGRDQTRTHTFGKTGTVKLGCNIHDDMRGYIRVTDTPWTAKTDRDGYLDLTGMPTGSAEVTVWHPQLRAPGGEFKTTRDLAAGDQGLRLRIILT